jgi:hypothetical protein
MTSSAAGLWLFGLVCLTVALLGSAVKVIGMELPAATERPTRLGLLAIGGTSLILGTVLFLQPGSTGGNEATTGSPRTDSAGLTGQPPATTTGRGGPSQGTSTPAGSPTAGGGPSNAIVLWHGKLRLTDGVGVDVGNLPVSVESNSLATSFWLYEGQALSGQSGNNLLSEWTAAGDPTPDQCAEQLRTQPIERIKGYRAGLRMCLHGLFDKRIGYAKVISYNGSASQVEITIWAAQLE